MEINVLIVDDSRTVQSIIEKTVRVSGIPVAELYKADDGQQALDILRSHSIDLVLTDINMPVMDGFEMIQHMCQENLLANTRVIVVSSDCSAARIDHAKKLGMSAYIHKPFTPELLHTVIESVVGPASTPEPETQAVVEGKEQEILARSLEQTLHEYAFLFSDVLDPAATCDVAGPYYRALVHFRGAFSGTLVVAAPEVLCCEMAAGVLGVDPDDAEAKTDAVDALQELLNVMSGNMVVSLVGTEDSIERTIPDVRRLGEEEWRCLIALPGSVGYAVNDYPLFLNLAIPE